MLWRAFQNIENYEIKCGYKYSVIVKMRNDLCGPGVFDLSHIRRPTEMITFLTRSACAKRKFYSNFEGNDGN